MSPRELKHTETELNQLISLIKRLDGESRIILVATGAYHFPIVRGQIVCFGNKSVCDEKVRMRSCEMGQNR